MPYNLGIKPDRLTVYLYRDADFDSVLFRTDDVEAPQDWDVAPRLVFPSTAATSWISTIVEDKATFQIDKAVTNLIPHGELVELWVADQCWAAGKVSKKGVLS